MNDTKVTNAIGKEVLEEARTLITDRNAWTQGSDARDADGNPVKHTDAKACKFCATGAIFHVSDLFGPAIKILAQTIRLEEKEFYDDYLEIDSSDVCDPIELIQGFNDETSHENVLDLFDRAIATLK